MRPKYANHVWSHDFVHRRTDNGRAFRALNIPDTFGRQCLTIKSVAVPIFNREKRCVASISISCHNMDRDLEDLVGELLPRLRAAADELSRSYPKTALR